MRRLLVCLAVVAAVVGALALTAGGVRTSGDQNTPGMAVPDVRVARLSGDGEFALRALAGAPTPTLLWFWAPWCEVCNHEAPAIERMAADSRGQLTVMAIGGRGEASAGREFAERHRLRTPALLFDEPMKSWNAYRIPAQPGAVLLNRSGRERGRWLGAFDTTEVLAAARAL